MRAWPVHFAAVLVVTASVAATVPPRPSPPIQRRPADSPRSAGDDHLRRASTAQGRRDQRIVAQALVKSCRAFAISDIPRAMDACSRAIAASRESGEIEFEAEALASRAIVHSWSITFDEGLADGQRALELVRDRPETWAFRSANLALGALYRERGDVGPALAYLKIGIEASEAAGDRYVESLSRSTLARTLFWIGDFDAARSEATRAQLLARRIHRPDAEFAAVWQRGMTELEAGQLGRAIAEFDDALRLARLVGNDSGVAMMHVNLADAYVQLEDMARAGTHLAAAQRLIDERRTPSLWQPYLYEIQGRIQLPIGNFGAAAEAFARAAGGSASAWLTVRALLGQARALRRNGDPRAARAAYERAISTVETSRAAIAADVHRASFMATNGAPYRELIALLWQMGGEAAAAQAFAISEAGRARALLDAVRAARARESNTVRPRPLGQVQAALGPSECLIQYVQADGRLFAFTVWRGGLRWSEIADERATREVASRIRFFQSLISQRAERSALVAAGSALYEDLLARTLPGGGAGITTLIISPDGALNHLPFDALMIPEASNVGPRFVAERYVVAYTPSASLLVDSDIAAQAESLGTLAVADPAPIAVSGGRASAIDLPLRPLPNSRREAALAVELLGRGGRYLEGSAATESAVKALGMGQFGVLHFATHALVDEVLPLRSALALGAGGREDGWLEAGEIYPMTLSAGLVVLSGCETGRGQTLSGEGVLSLARAFLHAGSRSVVATLWDIDDRDTEMLMQHFYGRLAASGRPDEALLLAKRAAIAAGMAPRVWAAFIPIGHLHDALVVVQFWTPRRVMAFGFGLIAVLATAVATAASLCQRRRVRR